MKIEKTWRHKKTVLQYSVKLLASSRHCLNVLISANILFSQHEKKLIPFGCNLPDQIIQVRYSERNYNIISKWHHSLTGNFSCRTLFVSPSRSLRGGGGRCILPIPWTNFLFNLRTTSVILMKLRPREKILYINVLNIMSIHKWSIFQDRENLQALVLWKNKDHAVSRDLVAV